MEGLVSDVRHALRHLARSPGFVAVAVVTLSLGIGANTAIFSVVDGVLLEELPYREPDRLVMVWEKNARGQDATLSPADFLDVRAAAESFEALAGFLPASYNLTGDGPPERLQGASVSPGFFTTLGLSAEHGRTFVEGPDAERSSSVVLGHGFWQRRLGSDPEAVGGTLTLDGETHTVVGVLPASFHFPPAPDTELWVRGRQGVPVHSLVADVDLATVRDLHYFRAVGRLRQSVGLRQARADLKVLERRLAGEHPEDFAGRTLELEDLRRSVVGDLRPALLILLASVGGVLLIACTNVANLLLVRGLARTRELALRAALGAGRLRLMRHAFLEGLLLAAAGGAGGLLLGAWSLEGLLRRAPAELTGLGDIHLDGSVLLFSLCASVASVFLFALAPALQSSRADLQEPLKESGTKATPGRRGSRLRALLVVVETALALVLLTAAALLVRSFLNLREVDAGFDARGVLTFGLVLPEARYGEEAEVTAFVDELHQRLTALPGVESASPALGLPLSGSRARLSLAIEGREDEAGDDTEALYQTVSEGYFRTLHIPVLQGRPLRPDDAADTRPVAVVNRAFVRRYLPDEEPLGRRLNFGAPGEDPWITIVGVAGDVRDQALETRAEPAVYVPFRQDAWPFLSFVLRTRTPPLAEAAAVRRVVHDLDPSLPVARLRPLADYLAESTAQRRFLMVLMGLFAALAAFLAVLGLYGVTAYAATQRSHEIGIRLALGARRTQVLGSVLRRSMALAGAGIAVGAVAALALSRFLETLLFGLSTTDPTTYGLVAALLAGTALAATLVPARRLARTDPASALRHE